MSQNVMIKGKEVKMMSGINQGIDDTAFSNTQLANEEKLLIQFPIALASLFWYSKKDPRTALGLAFIGSYLLGKVTFKGSNNLHLMECDVRDNITQLLHQILMVRPKIV